MHARHCSSPNGCGFTSTILNQHLGYQGAHDDIMLAIENVLREGANLTRDMGGKANTEELGKAIAAAI